MIAASHHLVVDEDLLPKPPDNSLIHSAKTFYDNKIQTLFPSRQLMHTPHSGLNPVVDAAGYLISAIGKIKFHDASYFKKIEKELYEELRLFQQRLQALGYQNEYIIVCRHILSAALDDAMHHISGVDKDKQPPYLQAFQHDAKQHDKFFDILRRAIQEPMFYIDIMELIYICLNMGYLGKFRDAQYERAELHHITDTLYKHIRAYRGNFTKLLSPHPLRITKLLHKVTKKTASASAALYKSFFATACAVMVIFISLSYLMDVLSDEVYTDIARVEKQLSNIY